MKKLAAKEVAIQGYRCLTWPIRCLSRWQAERNGTMPVYVLFYHRIFDDRANDWTMRTGEFEEQIGWLARHFDIVSLQEAQQRISGGHNTRPTVCITFDDGYADNSSHAIPLLMKRGLPFTYFVCLQNIQTGQPFPHDVKRGRPLEPNDVSVIRMMAKSANVEIGAHTRTHADLGAIDNRDELLDEVIAASRELETLIDHKVRYFAFPFGQPANLRAEVFHMLRQHGFAGACSAYGGNNEIGGDAFHIQRMHGDPLLARVQNWLTFDPRVKFVKRYEYQAEVSQPDLKSAASAETRPIQPEFNEPRQPRKPVNILDVPPALGAVSLPNAFSNTDQFN